MAWLHGAEAPFDRVLKRSRTRQCALVQNGEREPQRIAFAVVGIGQRRLAEPDHERMHPALRCARTNVEKPDAASRPDADFAACPPEDKEGIGVRAHPAQRDECGPVAVMRRRGE